MAHGRLLQVILPRCVLKRYCVSPFSSIKFKYSTSSNNDRWIIKSKHPSISIPDVSLPKLLFDAQEKHAHRISLVNGETDEVFTHGEIRTYSMNVASALTKRGVQKGDVIGIVSPNCPEFLISFLGVASTGAINTTVNCTYTADEIARQLQNAGATRVIVHPFFLETIKKTQEFYPDLKDIYLICGPSIPGAESLRDLMKDDGSAFPHNVQINPKEDLIVLPYSSGTTGLPKGVMLTHYNLVANLSQVLSKGVTDLIPSTDDYQESFVGVLPMFHIYGMVPCLCLSILFGSRMVTMAKFDAEAFVKNIIKHQITYLHAVPPIVSFLTTSPQITPQMLSSVKVILSGAAPSGATLIEQTLSKFKGLQYIEGYGLTEASPVTHLASNEGYGLTECSPVSHITPTGSAVVGSVGLSVPNTETKIVDLTTGEIIGPNQGEGELCIRGPQVMKGYYKNEKATKETVDSDGWLHTGDIAKIDENDNIFIVDRLKELIKVKGLQVAPAELEDLMRSHPSIIDVAVIGVPDERAGEVPKAFVVKCSDISESEVASFVEENVAPHKKLAGGVVFIDAIPKSATGKILRRELKNL